MGTFPAGRRGLDTDVSLYGPVVDFVITTLTHTHHFFFCLYNFVDALFVYCCVLNLCDCPCLTLYQRFVTCHVLWSPERVAADFAKANVDKQVKQANIVGTHTQLE